MVQKIEIVRCTSNVLQINVTDANGAAYTLGDGEAVVFGVKKEATDTDLLIVKTAESVGDGVFLVTLCPDDTEDLAAGRYWYDVGVEKGDNYFNVIELSPFVLVQNVTCRGCAT